MGLSGVVLSTGRPDGSVADGQPLNPAALRRLRLANTTLAGAARARQAGLLAHQATSATSAGLGGDPILDRFLLAIRQGVALAARSFPSVMWISSHSAGDADQPVVLTPSRSWTTRQLPSILLAAGDADAAADAAALQGPDGGLQPGFDAAASSPDVEVHCLFSDGVPTVNQLLYSIDSIQIRLGDPLPTALVVDGDGTVARESLAACKTWRSSRDQAAPVHLRPFTNYTHIDIIHSRVAIEYFLRHAFVVPLQPRRAGGPGSG